MQQSNQESYPSVINEVDLRKFINPLLRRKLFIFGFTAFFTLLAIIYSLYLTPTYKVLSSFTSPSDISIINLNKYSVSLTPTLKVIPSFKSHDDISIININKQELIEETKDSVFTSYLTHLSSKQLQTKIFLDGGYLTAFNSKNKPINDVDTFISNILDSVHLRPPDVTARVRSLGFLNELPYSISMQGSDPELISRYLNELVVAVNDKTINDFISVVKQKIKNRLGEIILEKELLIMQEKQQRLAEIEVLTYSAEIAKSLGILENNFKLISDDVVNSNFTIALSTNYELPNWYLYGERALNERIKLLKGRTNDAPFVDGLIDLDTEKRKLNSFVVDSVGLNAMQISQIAIVPISPIKPNKRAIVLLAFIGGFIMSILLALTMNAIKPDEEHST